MVLALSILRRVSPQGFVPAVKRSTVPGYRERGQPSLQLSQSRGRWDVGAQQVTAMNIPEIQTHRLQSQRAKLSGNKTGRGFRKDCLTVCYTGSRCPCPSHSCLSPSPRCLTSRNRTCRPLSPLRETQRRVMNIQNRAQGVIPGLICTLDYCTYSLPKCTCTVCLWFCTFRWSSDPVEINTVS